MSLSSLLPSIGAVIAALVTVAVLFLVWLFSLKRIAADTVGRAQDEARRLIQGTERDAEARHKEVALTAKEEAHDLLHQTEEQTRKRREELAALEKELAEKTHTIADRLAASERAAAALAAREQTLTQQEAHVATETARYTALVEDQQRELQRVSGMTADEAKHIITQAIQRSAHRDDGVGRRPAERRSQGSDHRSRGAEYPRARNGDRGRADHRRHAGRDHPLKLRPVSSRDRQAGDRKPDCRRPHSPRPHRRGRHKGAG